MRFRNVLTLGFAGSALSRAALCAQAQNFHTPDGSTIGGMPVDVSVTFTVTAGHLNIKVINNIVDQKDVAQNLSDLGFTFSTGQTLAMTTLSSSAGLERTINSNGTYSDA